MTHAVHISDNADALASSVQDWLLDIIRTLNDGRFAIALSGGSTPKRLYERLVGVDLPLERIHWFWGDERCVPTGDPLRNETMARSALLDHIDVPAENIHPIAFDPSPEVAAARFQAELVRWYGGEDIVEGKPLFDVMLLGLGSDGHTASLFPGKPALDETKRWSVSSEAGLEPFVPRVTLTFPALAASRHTAFLVSGADKAGPLKLALEGGDIPAARVRSMAPVQWFVDKAAMG